MSVKKFISTCHLLAQSLILLLCVLKTSEAQKNIMHQHQQQLNLTTQTIINQARPLDRPNLSSHSMNNVQNQSTFGSPASSSSSAQKESPADWFLMGGRGGDDLLTDEGKNVASITEFGSSNNNNINRNSTRRSSSQKRKNGSGSGSNQSPVSKSSTISSSNKTFFDDDEQSVDSSDSNEIFDDIEENSSSLAGTSKEPECAGNGRYYCTYKEDYPVKLVTEVTKYYKWPLEKLFRDLHAQIMPKLAQDATGNLVCDSITRVVRPGWTRNTNDRWLVVINTENYHQYVTEVVCQYGSNSRCNFIPPCYYSSCQQRYNTQKLLVIDPSNPYRGPFLSEFLFPSCCVCYVPSASDSFQDKYRSSPATIYQRTLQQESANNLYPPQFRPTGILEDVQASNFNVNTNIGQSPAGSSPSSPKGLSGSSSQVTIKGGGDPLGPGEIRRAGDQYKRLEPTTFQVADPNQQQQQQRQLENPGQSMANGNDLRDFPRL